ncbi:MAG: hypothetical protein QXV17_10690 [Candidatus Micrarchaeaceae archaeon]
MNKDKLIEFLEMVDLGIPSLFTPSENGFSVSTLQGDHVYACIGNFKGEFISKPFIIEPYKLLEMLKIVDSMAIDTEDGILKSSDTVSTVTYRTISIDDETVKSMTLKNTSFNGGVNAFISNDILEKIMHISSLVEGTQMEIYYNGKECSLTIEGRREQSRGSVMISASGKEMSKPAIFGSNIFKALKLSRGHDLSLNFDYDRPIVITVKTEDYKVDHIIAPIVTD